MSFAKTTLRPGLLVSVKTSITGNVKYLKRDLEGKALDANGTLTEKWETEKTVLDAVEQEEATRIRSAARTLISRVCSQSAFGLLCPETAEADLARAVAEARKLVEVFNDKSKLTRCKFLVLTGRVASDDVEAVKAINSEVRELLAEMDAGIRKLDPTAIRAAAAKAKQIGQMLTPDAQARITMALDAARAAASRITAAGQAATVEIEARALTTLAEARTAFLDLDMIPDEIVIPAGNSRAMELSPAEQIAAPAAGGTELELN